MLLYGKDIHIISIHAPGKGSDEKRQEIVKLHKISIHAPGKGSDQHSVFLKTAA